MDFNWLSIRDFILSQKEPFTYAELAQKMHAATKTQRDDICECFDELEEDGIIYRVKKSHYPSMYMVHRDWSNDEAYIKEKLLNFVATRKLEEHHLDMALEPFNFDERRFFMKCFHELIIDKKLVLRKLSEEEKNIIRDVGYGTYFLFDYAWGLPESDD